MMTKRAIGDGPHNVRRRRGRRRLARSTTGEPNRRPLLRQECRLRVRPRPDAPPTSPTTAVAFAAAAAEVSPSEVSYIFGKEGKGGRRRERTDDGTTHERRDRDHPRSESDSLSLSISCSFALKEGPKVGGARHHRTPARAPACRVHVGKRDGWMDGWMDARPSPLSSLRFVDRRKFPGKFVRCH